MYDDTVLSSLDLFLEIGHDGKSWRTCKKKKSCQNKLGVKSPWQLRMR